MSDTQSRIRQLQQWMGEHDLQFLLLPRHDCYFNEFLPPESERIAWLTGFTGSYGWVGLTPQQCILWSDGRYQIQMRAQTPDIVTCRLTSDFGIEDWLKDSLKRGDRLGLPQWQISVKHHQRFAEIAAETGAGLQMLPDNPIDSLWRGRPSPVCTEPEIIDERFCGEGVSKKIESMRKALAEQNCDAVFVGDVTMIAWLLNLRGSDVPYCPVNLAFSVIARDNTFLLTPQQKHTPELVDYCQRHGISLGAFAGLDNILAEFAGKNWLIDPAITPCAVKMMLEKNRCRLSESAMPLPEARACKNAAELAASRQAHIADGIAMVKFLHWLSRQPATDELTVTAKLEEFRRSDAHYRGNSFPTIAGFAENGAIIHYRSTAETNRASQGGDLLLLDSGGQYHYGTTDITRTIAFGTINDDAIKTDYTLVLKSHIRLAMLVFPQNTTGIQLDAVCRAVLWQHRKNYNHGTGHGVGVYLGVHEGNHHLSPRSELPIAPGMILSNEPGLYHEGHYGIRLENLIVAQNLPQDPEWLCFQTISLCPFDSSLIKPELLERSEIQWLNDYHTQVKETLMPHLQDQTVRDRLEAATQPL